MRYNQKENETCVLLTRPPGLRSLVSVTSTFSISVSEGTCTTTNHAVTSLCQLFYGQEVDICG